MADLKGLTILSPAPETAVDCKKLTVLSLFVPSFLETVIVPASSSPPLETAVVYKELGGDGRAVLLCWKEPNMV